MAKKALIDPGGTCEYISSWTSETDSDGIVTNTPTFSKVSNGQRVAEVKDATFEVASPLFWVDCSDSVVADEWYYDTSDSTIKLISSLNATEPS